MPPNGLLDILAALMLVIAAVSATRLAAAWLPAGPPSPAAPTGSRPWPGGLGTADSDIADLLMGIAMAGMLAASAMTLPPRAWEGIFGVLAVWFAGRAARAARLNGVRSLASGHSVVHLLQCAAMVYLFAITASGGMQVTGMGAGMARPLDHPTLTVAFAAVFAASTAWDLARLSRRRESRGVAGTCRIAMGATMTFMLVMVI